MVSFDGGSASKVDDVTALPSRHKMCGYVLLWQRYDNNKMVDMCYYGNVMTTRWRICYYGNVMTTRWWLCVTILHLQQYSHRLNFCYVFIRQTERKTICKLHCNIAVRVRLKCDVTR